MHYILKIFYKELEKEDLLYHEDILDCLKEYNPKIKKIDPKLLFNMMNDYELLVEKVTEHIY